jgi:hypothetical protein
MSGHIKKACAPTVLSVFIRQTIRIVVDKRVFYESMDLAHFMALCEVQGLPKTGTKLVLIEQLLEPAAILEKIALKAEDR